MEVEEDRRAFDIEKKDVMPSLALRNVMMLREYSRGSCLGR